VSTLVGDIVQQFRDLAQDPPQTLAAPGITALTAISTVGGTIPLGTYYLVLTIYNQWGETVASNEQSATLSGIQNSIQITWTSAPLGSIAGGLRAYIGLAAAAENSYIPFSFPASQPLLLTSPGTNAGAPPATSTAYLPDTDGSYVRASPVFRWLNDALRQGSRLMNGFTDYSGFPSTINFATYLITGEWTKMTQAWYDGYPVSFAPTSGFFKRNTVTSSILAGWSISFYNNQLGVEVWPQPARTATVTSLALPMLPTDTVATLTSTGGFLLPTYGMVQFGTEICAYNGISGNQLIGLLRGLGGTAASAWAASTPATELNAFFQGKRVFNTQYTPGQASLNLPIPAGMDGILINFLMSKFLETERDWQGAKAKMDSFTAQIKDYMRMNRQIAGPVQAGSRDYQFVVFGGTRFGGTILP
jgi:hypothetical protein